MVLQIDRKANAEQSGLIEASLTKSCRTMNQSINCGIIGTLTKNWNGREKREVESLLVW